MVDFGKVEDALADAKAIAWDGCHKIYVLMDDEQVALMRTYEYDPLITTSEMNPYDMFELIKQWYDDSCSLKFISAVHTNHEDPNEGFEDLIAQGEQDDCDDCGERGCAGVCNDDDEDDEEWT